MLAGLEYHQCVRRPLTASVVWLGLMGVPLFLASSGQAQINGAPASVTSPGFGGRAVNGTPSSVTSLGPNGYSSNRRTSFSTTLPNHHNSTTHHRRHHQGEYLAPYYAVPVPYAVDEGAADDADNEADYQGGPTIFDRRGQGAKSYVPPVDDGPAPQAARQADDAAADPEPQPPDPTVLVFKDGHSVEVGNYAIVGSTLYDMTPGHPRKIAIAELNLDATQKQNDDRGVVFQLPPSLRAN